MPFLRFEFEYDTELSNCWSTNLAHGSGTPSPGTGPTTGDGGSGNFVYLEGTSNLPGDTFTLSYTCVDRCATLGLQVGTVSFKYHMFGDNMGNLSLVTETGGTLWSRSGQQHTSGSSSWTQADVFVNSPSFYFSLERGHGYRSDIGVDSVEVLCAHQPRARSFPAP